MNIFYNADDRRARVVWRFAIALAVWFFFAIAATLITVFVVSPYEAISLEDEAMLLLLSAPGTLVGTIVALWVIARFVDRRPFGDYGVFLGDSNWWLDLAFGLLLGVGLQTVLFGVQLGLGWLTVTETLASPEGVGFGVAFLAPLMLFLCVGIYEELMFRSYLIPTLAESTPFLGRTTRVIFALVVTAAVFGIAHARNPNATLVSTVNITLAGIMLGLPFVLTRSVAAPIGLHISWNLFMGNVFGFPVSGLPNTFASVLLTEQGGPTLWTGGDFGPEAGLLGLLAILAGSALIVVWTRWRDGTVAVDATLADYTPR